MRAIHIISNINPRTFIHRCTPVKRHFETEKINNREKRKGTRTKLNVF